MNAFHFGTAERPLFGVYLPAHPGRERDTGVVLCYPYGWEYLRGHRAFRQLAARLSDAGYHVLRFDYFGTGDSAGESWEATPDQWLEDVATAIDELRDTAGVRRVSLVGMGVGGLLAARVAARREDLDRLVLWDPVVSGAEHLAGLAAAHSRLGQAAELAPDIAGAAEGLDLEGFPLGAPACAQLGQADLLAAPPPRVRSVLTVTTQPDPRADRLANAYAGQGIAMTSRLIPPRENGAGPGDDFVNTVMPTEVLDAVVEYFLEGDS